MIAVTGGAGFIGSRLVEKLVENHQVKVIDNLSSGKKENIPDEAELVEKDINQLTEKDFENAETVFHLAANPKVNTFPGDREKDFQENSKGTKAVLDACKQAGVEEIVFASSSVVYGEDTEIPTPETARMKPISMYAATKCSGEHMSQVYSRTFDMELTIVRLANIVGGRNQKGVIYDFIHKLKENEKELEILGNGKQRKSYIHISDTVSGILTAWNSDKTVFNIGNKDAVSVTEIANIVAEEMGLDPEYSYTGGERGWTGDVPEMRLSIEKLKNEGWRSERDSEGAVRQTVRELL